MPQVHVTRLVLVPFDQLDERHGALRDADRTDDVIVFVESQRMVEGRGWHRQRLAFLISSARHFAERLRANGWNVEYVTADTTVDGLADVAARYPGRDAVCAEPNSYRLRAALVEAGVLLVPNDFFLASHEQFASWADGQRSFTMESFYREQRRRLGILVESGKPEGGSWNYDEHNRLPPPRDHDWGTTLTFARDEIDSVVEAGLPASAWGSIGPKVWGTTRDEALAQLAHFLEHHFAAFGPYEDAMPRGTWSGHHSLLSPYLNNGLLHPAEIVEAAMARYREGGIPIESCEGFIRQVIGWREYVRGMYWYLGEDYRDRNALAAHRPLLPLLRDPSATKMACVSSVVGDVQTYGWTHHIPRLMVLGNLALLAGVRPAEFLDWMREVFIDAADWVMVPNVIGMAVHADGGTMMTKPYAAGGAYISRMGRFCGDCAYDPKKRTGDTACPFTTLYWDFLDRNAPAFEGNHRMAQPLAGLKRLADLDEVRARAREVLTGLDEGSV